MKRSKVVLLLLLSFTLLRSAPSFADTCTPRGFVVVGPFGFYDYIANGDPASTECWSPRHASFVTNQTTCGQLSPTHNAFQFDDGGYIHQEFTVLPDFTSQQFSLTFMFDYTDPLFHGGQNYLVAEVFDLTNGAPLGFFRHDGTIGNAFCQRVDMNITADLAGHPIQVRFISQKRDARSIVRVWGIAFFQGPLS
jgi:hypothetical protein